MLLLVCAMNNNDEFIIAEKFGTMGAMSVGVRHGARYCKFVNFLQQPNCAFSFLMASLFAKCILS